jgi:hypothetical protein
MGERTALTIWRQTGRDLSGTQQMSPRLRVGRIGLRGAVPG